MNKTDRFKKKLQIVLYILLILSILRSFLVRARAEGTEDYLLQIESTYFDNINSSNRDIIEGLISEYDLKYFFIGRSGGTVGDISSRPSQSILLFLNTDEIYIERFLRCAISPSYGTIRDTYYNDTSSLYFAFNNTYSVNVWSDYTDNPFTGPVHGIAIWQDYNGNPWGIQFSMTFNNGVSSNYSYSSIGSMTQGNTNYNNAFSIGNYISYGNYYAFSSVTSGGNCYYCRSSIDIVPTYPDDSRFHARTYLNAFDQNMLEVKWDSSVYPNTGNMNYLKSILQLTIDVNDTPVVVSFDSEEYPDLFPTENTSYIPYYFLDSVGNIVDISDLDSAYLTRIELTQYAYPSGAPSSSATSYYAQTSYNLSLTDTVQLPVWDNPVISPGGGHIIDIATGNVYDNVSFSPPDGYNQQHFADLESVPWADVKVVSAVDLDGNSTDALEQLYKDYSNVVMRNWNYFYDQQFTDFNDVASRVQADNQYSDTYDIIVFLWNDNNSDLCWVTYTERYYIRLMYKQFGNFQTIMEGGFAYVSDIYNYMYDRFEPLNNNLISFFDSTLSNNAILLKYARSINGYCNSINNGIDRVIGSGGRSLTDIYNRLGDLSVGGGGGFILSDFMNAFESKMNYLFVPTYDGLEDTFDTAIDDLGILALPFVFSSDLITACKVPYSSTLDITFPSMSIPWHEEMEGGSVDSTLVLWDDYDVSFNPSSVIPSEWLEFFQYLNALLVLVSVTLMTYRHIFSRHASESEGTL